MKVVDTEAILTSIYVIFLLFRHRGRITLNKLFFSINSIVFSVVKRKFRSKCEIYKPVFRRLGLTITSSVSTATKFFMPGIQILMQPCLIPFFAFTRHCYHTTKRLKIAQFNFVFQENKQKRITLYYIKEFMKLLTFNFCIPTSNKFASK